MIYVFCELFITFLLHFWIYRLYFSWNVIIPVLSNIYGPVLLIALIGNKQFRDSIRLFSCCANTVVREFCDLNRGTEHREKTVIGSNCLLMAYVHVAHDCIVGDRVIMANGVQLAS